MKPQNHKTDNDSGNEPDVRNPQTATREAQQLQGNSMRYKGESTCPACRSENEWCFEHQQVQHIMERKGYDSLLINIAIEEPPEE